MPHPLNYADFKAHFDNVAALFERRRTRFKLRFIFLGLIALGLIGGLPWYCSHVLEAFNAGTGSVIDGSGGHWKKSSITFGDKLAFSILVTVLAAWLALWPVFSYRGRNKNSGLIIPMNYSFKDHVYSQLLRYFDGFQFAADGGTFIADIKESTIIPDYQLYFAEDYTRGVINDCTVKLAETRIVQMHGGKRIAIFSGLVIVIDISDIKVKLTGNFAGRTVLIADKQKEMESIRAKYAGFDRVALTSEYEEHFEAYTSNEGEAKALLAPGLLAALLELQGKLQNLTQQKEHIDSRLAHLAFCLIEAIPLWPRSQGLTAERAYDRQFWENLDVSKADIISLSNKSINQHVQAEFYNDKLLITVPCTHDLFEPNSLFEKALNDEDAQVLFSIIESIEIITGTIKTYLANR